MGKVVRTLASLILLAGIGCFLPVAAAVSAQGVLPPPNIVNWWPGDGSAEDFVGSNHGTLMNGATFASGKVGQAFSLDGYNDYVNVGRTDFSNALTIEAWVYPRSFGAYSTIYARWYDGTEPDRGVVFQIRGNTHLRLGVINDSNILDGAYTFQPNQWYHVAGTWDGSTSRVYVNGVQVGSRSTSGTFTNQNVDAAIGVDPRPSQYYFNGLIDEVTVYSRALSSSEIRAVFVADSAGKCKDKTPPATEVSFSGTAGHNGWFRSNVDVILTASDNPGGSGVSRTEYSFDGTNWTIYSNPFTLASEGSTTFYYRSVDNVGNIEVQSRIPAFHQVNMTGVFNSDAYTMYQNYENSPNTGYYRVYPGNMYPDPVYGNVPMDMKPKGTNNVWLSRGLERTVSFPTQLTLNMNVPNATNIWVVGLDGGWVFNGTQVDIRYTVDGMTRTATYYPNDWCWSGTGAGLRLWVSGDHADIAVARIDLPVSGNLTNVTIVDVGGSAQASIPVFAVTVRYETPVFKSATVKIDKTAPTLTFAEPTPLPNAAGWHSGDVSIAFTAADSLSGVASVTPSSPLVLSAEGSNITGSVTVTDLAGNSAIFFSPAVRIDKTPPVITINVPVSREYTTGDVITIDYAVSDRFSGIEVATVTLDGLPVSQGETISLAEKAGTHTFTVTCTDVAGNTNTRSVIFSVAIAAAVDIKPDSLNTKSKGNPITVYIEFPEGYDVAQIDVATVKLKIDNTQVNVEPKPTAITDYDGDGLSDLMVKFDREAVIAALNMRTGDVTLAVTGVLKDGRKFMGTDTIRVLNK